MPGSVRGLFGRCLWPLWEQHPRSQQIHWHTSRMPGERKENKIEYVFSSCIISFLEYRKNQLDLLQDLCSQNAQCHFFTHFSTQCYLLVECGDSEQYENIIIILSSSFFTKNLSWPFPFSCTGCVSGPTSPAFGSCPWPPSEYFSSSFYLSLS